MVKFFGGVPLRTAGVTNYGADLDIARSTSDEIYAQVISDLTDAYAKLPTSNGEFADRYAAQALLARVYLQQGNYASALAAANDVLQNSGHSLASSFARAFNNDSDSSEDIFAFQVMFCTVYRFYNNLNNIYTKIDQHKKQKIFIAYIV